MNGEQREGADGAAEILPRVRAVLAQQFSDTDTVPDDTPLPDALGGRYDSLAALEFISAVEREFGIEVDFVAHDVTYWFSELRLVARFVADALEDMAVAGAGMVTQRDE